MATLPPPPTDSALGQPDGRPTPSWARWFQQLWDSTARVQLTTGGPCVVHGPGAPVSSLPNGSLYLRTDGVGPNLYVRENGAWVAK